MATTERPHLAVDTMALIRAEADALGVPLTDFLEAAVEAAAQRTAPPSVVESAHRELTAYQRETAVKATDLELPTAEPTLCVRGGSWVDEPITGDVVRQGYGVRLGASPAEWGSTLRGFHRVRAIDGGVRMVLFRRGVPIIQGWGEDWGEIEHNGSTRRFARRMLVSDGQHWWDIDSARISTALNDEDLAVEAALTELVVRFTPGNRNPVFWASGAQR